MQHKYAKNILKHAKIAYFLKLKHAKIAFLKEQNTQKSASFKK